MLSRIYVSIIDDHIGWVPFIGNNVSYKNQWENPSSKKYQMQRRIQAYSKTTVRLLLNPPLL